VLLGWGVGVLVYVFDRNVVCVMYGVCLRINNKGEAGKCERERKRPLSFSLSLSLFLAGSVGGGGTFSHIFPSY
jgi:hypothetical protein